MRNQSHNFCNTSNGFTMIELVMVMVLTGILAVAVIPRFVDRKAFDARGFFDQSISMVRYAQKVAIAQHRDVFVNVTASTICLTYVADALCSGATIANRVINPADQNWFLKTAPAGMTFGGAVSFSFSALGRPTSAIALSFTGDGATSNITVERETGYVH
ncbi:MAG: type II secretion system protein [Undibacterium sp.]|uniref:pilus assembly FimT family protein n=1 Tax=Undibacterium sp. TaxID=1914977 RepID=UPI0027168143|nr:type II secretion system protein [Undibacterium sp.]MDO8651998.1 type II secretion system protein [Undibacterium sp.]